MNQIINKEHCFIETACLRINDTYEIIDTFHTFLNPQREVDIFAYKVHRKNLFDLRHEPLFSEIVDEFLEFIQNDTLVIHNAPFDLSFLNYELSLCNKPSLTNSCIDTLTIARKKYPKQKNSMDALCECFNIDNSARILHNAVIDTELLLEVFKHLCSI